MVSRQEELVYITEPTLWGYRFKWFFRISEGRSCRDLHLPLLQASLPLMFKGSLSACGDGGNFLLSGSMSAFLWLLDPGHPSGSFNLCE